MASPDIVTDLQQLMDMTPNTPENQGLLRELSRLLSANQIIKKPFSYTADFSASTFTSGATLTVNVPIQSDAPFLILNQTYSADVAAAGQTASSATYPLVNVFLTDTGSGVQLMSQAVPVTQIFGNGQFPYVLPEPYLMQARGNLTVQATNRDAAQAYNLFLTFNGVKLFALG